VRIKTTQKRRSDLPVYKFLVESKYLRLPYSRRLNGKSARWRPNVWIFGRPNGLKLLDRTIAAEQQINGIGSDTTNAVIVLALLGAALILWWLCKWHPSVLPFWTPWEFSWPQFLTIVLTVWWYLRGLALTAAADRPSLARQLSFLGGMVVIYTMIQTRFEYLAEHMFFLNRVQHIGMHHLGPLLVALSWPGATIKLGMPASVRRLAQHRIIPMVLSVVQQPVLAAALFVGLVAFWLVPPVHFYAMVDPNVYAIMNWSMVVDGILFWCLVLDPRPKPPARTSFGTRTVLATIVMFPQILIGAIIALATRDLYPFYDLCGRIYPAIEAGTDQVIGGLIVWIPAAMMSVVALIMVINAFRRYEDATKENAYGKDLSGSAIQAALWTGR
jgi:putative membrane protein